MMLIPLDHIRPNPDQPRQSFDQAKLEELAQSIKEHGILQPIGVVMTDESDDNGYFYTIQFGERRWRASQMAGLTDIPAVVIDPDDLGDEASILARGLVENVQREDLSPLEVAKSYQQLSDLGWSDDKIAKSMGKGRSTIANARRLLTLPAEVRLPLAQGKISERQAQALIPLYKLPETAREALKKSYNSRPEDLLKNAVGGLDSGELRNSVERAIHYATEDMSRWPFVDFAFTEDVVSDNSLQAPLCSECPIRVKSGKEWRCADEDCSDAKLDIYKQIQLEAAMDASGLAPLELADDESRWDTVKQLYHYGQSVGRRILQQGCGNLRLEYLRYPDDHPIIDGFPHICLSCHHGIEIGNCVCLKAILAEQSKNDPAKAEEAAAKRQLEKEVVTPAVALFVEALTGDDPTAAFRLFLPRVSNIYQGADEWPLEKILNRLVRSIINGSLPYRGHDDIPGSLQRVKALFETAGLAWPTDTSAADKILDDAERKIERIAKFLDRPDTPNEKARDGNVANLNELVEVLDDLYEQELGDGYCARIEELLSRVYELQEKLSPATIVDQHLSNVAEELGQIADFLEAEITYQTLRQYRDRLQEIFRQELDLPGPITDNLNALLHRWEALVAQVDERANAQYRKDVGLAEEPTHE